MNNFNAETEMTLLHSWIVPLLIFLGIVWVIIIIVFSIAKKPRKHGLAEEKNYLSERIDHYNATISQFNIQKAGAICSAVYKKDSKTLHLIEEENTKFIAISNLCTQYIELLRKNLNKRKVKPCEDTKQALNHSISQLDKSLLIINKLRSGMQSTGKETSGNTEHFSNSNTKDHHTAHNNYNEQNSYNDQNTHNDQDDSKHQRTQNQSKEFEISEEGFFLGCKTKDELEKRYKMLVKAFHPDTGYGDETLFKNMTAEYNKLKSNL